jgi:hypothetical protein
MREAIFLSGYPPEDRADCRENQRTSHNPVTKTSGAFVDRRAGRTVDSDPFQVGEQFHEAHLIRITDRRFTIWLHPFGVLDSEVVMDLPPKLGVSVNVVSLRHCLGENSSVQPNGSSKATSPSSTSCRAMSARQAPGLGQLAAFLALALQQHGQQSALRESRGRFWHEINFSVFHKRFLRFDSAPDSFPYETLVLVPLGDIKAR